jgi:hypothetical protein
MLANSVGVLEIFYETQYESQPASLLVVEVRSDEDHGSIYGHRWVACSSIRLGGAKGLAACEGLYTRELSLGTHMQHDEEEKLDSKWIAFLSGLQDVRIPLESIIVDIYTLQLNRSRHWTCRHV